MSPGTKTCTQIIRRNRRHASRFNLLEGMVAPSIDDAPGHPDAPTMLTFQGTLGQLLVNPQLYDSLNGATREFQSLAKDMRANPKKFLTIRLSLF